MLKIMKNKACTMKLFGTRNVTVCHLISILLFINRIDKQLKYLEAKHHLPCRWNPADREYTEARNALNKYQFYK